MAYVTQEQVETEIPAPHLVEALDDNRDGVADAGKLDDIIESASTAVDSYLAGLYTVPFPEDDDEKPLPAKVKRAAFVFTCESIYRRRGIPTDQNPFTKEADALRAELKEIGQGKAPLDATQTRKFTPGAAITEPMATEGSTL